VLKKKILSAALSGLLMLGALPLTAGQVYAASVNPTLMFSESGINETVAGNGYTISGTTLTIGASGVYRIK